MVASTLGGGVWNSLDHGDTWTEFSSGLGDLAVNALLHRPDQPSVLFALTYSAGLFKRVLGTDTSWIASSNGLPTGVIQARSDASFEDMFEDPIIYSTNTVNALAPLLSMSISSQNSSYMLVGTDGLGVYRSTNGGTSWIPSGLSGSSVRSVVVDPTNTEHWYAATATTGGIYVTSTGGSSYQFLPLPDQPTLNFNTLMISPTEPGVVYAGTDSGIYKLENGTWSYVGLYSKVIKSLAEDPARPDHWYAGTSAGVYFSWDQGSNWYPGPYQLAGDVVQTISFDPAVPNQVFFGTQARGSLSYNFEP